MKFTNEIQLALPPDEVFAALTDVERVASCLPGARVTGREGDAYSGAMRIKVGPIVVDYGGTLSFEELDRDQRRAALLAVGEETAGQGSAEAHIVSSVLEEAEGARVIVETDLQVRGRVAQFGSGAMEKIAKRMFEDFAKNLETAMTSPEQSGPSDGPATGGGTGPASPEAGRASPPGGMAGDDSLNVFALVGEPLGRSLRSAAIPMLIALAIGYLLGRARGAS